MYFGPSSNVFISQVTNHPLPGDKPFCTIRRLMCWLEIRLLIPGELTFIFGRISSNNLASSDECLYTAGRTCTSLWPCLLCVSCLPAISLAHLFIVSSDRKNRASSELDFVTSCYASADDSRANERQVLAGHAGCGKACNILAATCGLPLNPAYFFVHSCGRVRAARNPAHLHP
jgi:hypothetical protein